MMDVGKVIKKEKNKVIKVAMGGWWLGSHVGI